MLNVDDAKAEFNRVMGKGETRTGPATRSEEHKSDHSIVDAAVAVSEADDEDEDEPVAKTEAKGESTGAETSSAMVVNALLAGMLTMAVVLALFDINGEHYECIKNETDTHGDHGHSHGHGH